MLPGRAKRAMSRPQRRQPEQGKLGRKAWRKASWIPEEWATKVEEETGHRSEGRAADPKYNVFMPPAPADEVTDPLGAPPPSLQQLLYI